MNELHLLGWRIVFFMVGCLRHSQKHLPVHWAVQRSATVIWGKIITDGVKKFHKLKERGFDDNVICN